MSILVLFWEGFLKGGLMTFQGSRGGFGDLCNSSPLQLPFFIIMYFLIIHKAAMGV